MAERQRGKEEEGLDPSVAPTLHAVGPGGLTGRAVEGPAVLGLTGLEPHQPSLTVQPTSKTLNTKSISGAAGRHCTGYWGLVWLPLG